MRRRYDMSSSSSSGTKKVCSFPVTFSAQKYLFVHQARKWNEERERDRTPFPLIHRFGRRNGKFILQCNRTRHTNQGHDITNSQAPQATKKQWKTPDPLTRSCKRNSWEISVVVAKHHPNLSSMGRADQWADRSKQVLMQKITWRRIAVETHPPFDDTIVCTTAMCSRVDLTLPPTMCWLLMRSVTLSLSLSLSLCTHHFSSIWTSCKTVSSYVFCLSWGRKHCSSFLVLLQEAIYKVTGVKIGYTYALGTRPHSGWISQFKKSPWPALPWTHHEHMTVCGYFANSSRQLSSYLSEGPCV